MWIHILIFLMQISNNYFNTYKEGKYLEAYITISIYCNMSLTTSKVLYVCKCIFKKIGKEALKPFYWFLLNTRTYLRKI